MTRRGPAGTPCCGSRGASAGRCPTPRLVPCLYTCLYTTSSLVSTPPSSLSLHRLVPCLYAASAPVSTPPRPLSLRRLVPRGSCGPPRRDAPDASPLRRLLRPRVLSRAQFRQRYRPSRAGNDIGPGRRRVLHAPLGPWGGGGGTWLRGVRWSRGGAQSLLGRCSGVLLRLCCMYCTATVCCCACALCSVLLPCPAAPVFCYSATACCCAGPCRARPTAAVQCVLEVSGECRPMFWCRVEGRMEGSVSSEGVRRHALLTRTSK
jgi:hypothetical protein